MSERVPLTVERIVDTAAAMADRGGLASVSMRAIGRELGVEGMAIYHHLANKDALLDALADWVSARMELPGADEPWRTAIRNHALSVRATLVAHPWALAIVDSRSSPGDATLRRNDAVVRCLRRAGFSVRRIAHAQSVIDAYVYGFALTERNLPFDPATGANEFVAGAGVDWDRYPALTELVTALVRDGDYSFSAEFEIGLDIILGALEPLAR